MQTHILKTNRNRFNLFFDVVIFIAFLITMAPRFSGIAIHEWLSIAFGAAIVTHLLLHWFWLVEVTKRFFGKVQWSARINYVLNALLFIDLVLIIFTGLVISREALPLFNIQTVHGGSWGMLHRLSADIFPFLMGLHVALHWRWIVNTSKRLINRRQPRLTSTHTARSVRNSVEL